MVPALCLALLLGLGCLPPRPQNLSGDYERQHGVYVFHGNEPVETRVSDRLNLQAEGTSRLRFTLQLQADRGRSCRISGIAGSIRRGFEYRDTGSATACTLRFSGSRDTLDVEDLGGFCAKRYCDEGASIGALTFAGVTRRQ